MAKEVTLMATQKPLEEYGAHNPAPYGTIGGQPVHSGVQQGIRTIPSAEPGKPEKPEKA